MASSIKPSTKFTYANSCKTDELIRALTGGRVEMVRRFAEGNPRFTRQWNRTPSMRTKDVIKAVRQHRGPVFTALYGNDGFYRVQCVKVDLLATISGAGDGDLEATETNGEMFVSRLA